MMSLEQVAAAANGSLLGADVMVARVATDTRVACEDALFIALRGENYDAHDYLNQAQQAGAIAALVAREVETDLPQVLVDDTHVALTKLAYWWRRQQQPCRCRCHKEAQRCR